MTAAESIDDLMEPLGAPGWADQVAADSRADDDRFVLTDDRMASWALRKIAKARAEIARVEQDVAERKALLDDYSKRATANPRHDESFFTALLEDWHRRVLEQDEDRKTVDLPEGRISSTTTQPSAVLDGKGASERLAAWARKHLPELVSSEVVHTVPAAKLKKRVRIHDDRVVLVDADGQMVDVDGLKVKPKTTTFTVDTDGGAA